MKASAPPLSDDVQRLLAAERGAPPASDDLRARALARAAAAFREGAVIPTRWVFRRRIPLLAAAALGVLVALAALAAYRAAGDADRGTAPSTPAVTPVPASVPDTTPSAVERAEPTPGAVGTAESQKAADPSAAVRRPSPDEAYAAELAMLQRARAAVARGNHSAALEAIAEHQRRFPTGRLREEREALRVKALAGLGRRDEARRAAERFKTEFPRSVLSSSIEQTTRPPR